MIIENAFLNVKFTEVTLLHILILLGIPYLIFYFFEKFTKFDKFYEKWEGALFLFSIGGIGTFLSLLGHAIFNYPFCLFYLIFLVYLIIVLWIIKLILFPKMKIGRIRVKLNNGEIYIGEHMEDDSKYLKLGKTKFNKMIKITSKEKKELEAKRLILKKEDIQKIFYY